MDHCTQRGKIIEQKEYAGFVEIHILDQKTTARRLPAQNVLLPEERLWLRIQRLDWL